MILKDGWSLNLNWKWKVTFEEIEEYPNRSPKESNSLKSLHHIVMCCLNAARQSRLLFQAMTKVTGCLSDQSRFKRLSRLINDNTMNLVNFHKKMQGMSKRRERGGKNNLEVYSKRQ
jgi:hypothetical protein